MTQETDGNAFKMWASGVVEQLKDLKKHVDVGLGEVRSAILQLALTDAEVDRLKEDSEKLKARVKELEDSELVRIAKLDTIKSFQRWMIGLMTTVLISIMIAFILSRMGI